MSNPTPEQAARDEMAILAYAKCGCIFAATWDGADPVRAAEFIKSINRETLAFLRFADPDTARAQLDTKMRRHPHGYNNPDKCPVILGGLK